MASSASQLRDLGGVSGVIVLLDSATASVDVKESAALALANTTQRDDDVCLSVGHLPAPALSSLLKHIGCKSPLCVVVLLCGILLW